MAHTIAMAFQKHKIYDLFCFHSNHLLLAIKLRFRQQPLIEILILIPILLVRPFDNAVAIEYTRDLMDPVHIFLLQSQFVSHSFDMMLLTGLLQQRSLLRSLCHPLSCVSSKQMLNAEAKIAFVEKLHGTYEETLSSSLYYF